MFAIEKWGGWVNRAVCQAFWAEYTGTLRHDLLYTWKGSKVLTISILTLFAFWIHKVFQTHLIWFWRFPNGVFDHSTQNLLKGCSCKPWATLQIVTFRGEDLHPGSEMRLDHLKLLCNKVLLKYKGIDIGLFWHRHQKRAESVLVLAKSYMSVKDYLKTESCIRPLSHNMHFEIAFAQSEHPRP